MLKIAIGSDHGGVDYKQEVIKYLESKIIKNNLLLILIDNSY